MIFYLRAKNIFMKIKYYLLLTFFIFFGKNVLAQTTADSIIQCKQFRFCYQNKIYSKGELGQILEINPMAYKAYRNSKTYTRVSFISGIIVLPCYFSSVSISDDSGRAAGRGQIFLASVGVLAAGTSLVTFFVSRTKFWKSIRLFNQGIQENKLGKLPLELNLKYTGTGVGVILNF